MHRRVAGLCIVALILGTGCLSPTDRPPCATTTIQKGADTVVTTENFVRLRRFIIAQGRRRTYCSAFNYNPYFPFTRFNLYLNPADQRNINCEIRKSDFPTLVIQTCEPGPYRYWHVHLDEDRQFLRMESPYANAEADALREQVASFFEQAQAEIEALQEGEGVASLKPQGNQANVRLCICMPDGHYYNLASDRSRLGSTGDRFHDIETPESAMSEALWFVRSRPECRWECMTSVTPYPPSHTVLLWYGCGGFMCSLGPDETSAPVMEELLDLIPEPPRQAPPRTSVQ